MENNRFLILKFYVDQPNLGVTNAIRTFYVKSHDEAARIICQFESRDVDTNIRAAFLVPNDKTLSKNSGGRYEYKDDPFYLDHKKRFTLKGSY